MYSKNCWILDQDAHEVETLQSISPGFPRPVNRGWIYWSVNSFMCPIGGRIMREIEPRYPAFILVKRTAYMLICTPIIELKKDMEWGALAQALTISKENIFCPYASLTGKAI